MKTKNYEVALMVNSAMLILCGLWNLLWKFMRNAYKIMSSLQDVTSQDFDYTNVSDWTGLLGTGSTMGSIHSISANLALYLQLIAGTVGLIYAGIIISKHIPKFSSLPFVLGVIIDIVGGLALLTLFCSQLYPIGFTQVSLVFSLLVIPIIFTIYMKKFSNRLLATI